MSKTFFFSFALSFLIIIGLGCSNDDSPEEPQILALPSWNMTSYLFLSNNIVQPGTYLLHLQGTWAGDGSDLGKGILYAIHDDPTFESGREVVERELNTQGRVNQQFTVATAELAAKTTYYYRTFRRFDDRVEYGDVMSITTNEAVDPCGISRHSRVDLVTGRYSNANRYYYDHEGKLIFDSNSSVVHPGLSSSAASELYRYTGDSVFVMQIKESEVLEEKPKGYLMDQKPLYWYVGDGQYYSFSYPDEHTVTIKRVFEIASERTGNSADSIVYHLNNDGNIELKQDYYITDNGYELKYENKYYFTEFVNPFKGNLSQATNSLFFNNNFYNRRDSRTLPATDFNTGWETPVESRWEGDLTYYNQGLTNILDFTACD